MKIFGYYIYARDFIPPLFCKIRNHIIRKLQRESAPNPPFDSVSPDLEAKWILDVGANYGHVTIAGLTTYANSKAICFEPVKDTFQQLQTNLAPYGGRVVFYNQALSDTNGTANINITSTHGASSIEAQSAFHMAFNPHVREIRQEEIELVRLDDVALNFPTDYIDILKIDVEGHELNVLKGGAGFISSRVDTIIIEIALQRDQSWEKQSVFEIFALLDNWGFRLINIYDLHRVKNSSMVLVQMDCVFRHKSRLPA